MVSIGSWLSPYRYLLFASGEGRRAEGCVVSIHCLPPAAFSLLCTLSPTSVMCVQSCCLYRNASLHDELLIDSIPDSRPPAICLHGPSAQTTTVMTRDNARQIARGRHLLHHTHKTARTRIACPSAPSLHSRHVAPLQPGRHTYEVASGGTKRNLTGVNGHCPIIALVDVPCSPSSRYRWKSQE